MKNVFRSLPVALGAWAMLAAPAGAAPTADVYGKPGAWTVEAWSDGPDIRMCSATVANPSARPDYGSFLRLENRGRDWTIASDYLISGNSANADLMIDGVAYPVRFSLDGPVVRAPLDRRTVDAIAAGNRLNLNLDPSGQNFSLRGAQEALAMAEQCVRSNGLQNVGNPGTNDYNGYDVAGTPQARESRYASVRGWDVAGGTVAGNFAYCVGQFDDNGSIWRLGWDGMQWQVGLPVAAPADWNGYIDIDGDRRPISGSAKNGWTFLWLGRPDLDKIRAGNAMNVDLGNVIVAHPLVGTAAVVTKIEECMQRKGQGGSASAAPTSHTPTSYTPTASAGRAGGGAGCPDDGGRLPFTGICAGRASAYLMGQPTYGDYLPDPGCQWVVNEVQVVEDALLYRALRCKGVTAQLDYAGGAQWAQLMVVRSALNAAYGQTPEVSDPKPLVWFNTIDPRHVERDLDMRARQGAETLRGRKCVISRADPATSPDGYVFDLALADPLYARKLQGPTEPLCGAFSYGDGAVRFWRVLGDYAFLFDMSADLYQDIDPNTVTLLRKDGSGNWAAVQ